MPHPTFLPSKYASYVPTISVNNNSDLNGWILRYQIYVAVVLGVVLIIILSIIYLIIIRCRNVERNNILQKIIASNKEDDEKLRSLSFPFLELYQPLNESIVINTDNNQYLNYDHDYDAVKKLFLKKYNIYVRLRLLCDDEVIEQLQLIEVDRSLITLASSDDTLTYNQLEMIQQILLSLDASIQRLEEPFSKKE